MAAAFTLVLAACGSTERAGPAEPAAPAVSDAPGAALAVPAQPEIATGWQAQRLRRFARAAVAAAHPLAAEAGKAMLEAGGTAADAAVAVQAVLALVEPQSSGIGGGAFLLHFDGQRISAWDGRETAPAAADERLFLKPDGQPMDRADAVRSGRAVGVPGVMRMLEAVHRVHGRLPWAQVLAPAIALAEDGVPIGARLHRQLEADPALRADPLARAHFYDADGQPWPVGTRRPNPAMAQVLRRLASEGADALHTGAIAQDIVQRVGSPPRPGAMTLQDLAGYQPRERAVLCTDWRSWRVCGMPPPSSGQLAIGQILHLFDRARAVVGQAGAGADAHSRALDWTDPATLHRYAEAAKLAFADRALYVADPDRVRAPGGDWRSLLDAAYLDRRALRIGVRSMGRAEAGRPGPADDPTHAQAMQAPQAEHGTSHISIVDADGHAVAMTTSIEAAFGARRMSDGGTGLPGGFLLNNQLTDFAFQPQDAQGRWVANRAEGGKRPRSSMSPTLVFDRESQRLVAVAGSPGGAFIIHFTAKVLLGLFDAGLDPQAAIDWPNAGNFNGPMVLERGRFPVAVIEGLKARGHAVREVDLPSGLQVLCRGAGAAGGWLGGADPRREGVVRGY